MEIKEYEVLYKAETEHWWYVGLHRLVFQTLDSLKPEDAKIRLLDAGCGTGGVLAQCLSCHADGFDVAQEAVKFCHQRGLTQVKVGSMADIPFEDGMFDLALSLDVIAHVDPQYEKKSLKELYRILKPGGKVILNMPAYELLRSKHDWAVHIHHRYTRSELVKKLEEVGFVIERISYRNTFLFPFLALKRLFERMILKEGEVKPSDLTIPMPKIINQLLLGILTFENKLLQFISFPYGLSIFCVAKKL